VTLPARLDDLGVVLRHVPATPAGLRAIREGVDLSGAAEAGNRLLSLLAV